MLFARSTARITGPLHPLFTLVAALAVVAGSLGISAVVGMNETVALYLVAGLAVLIFSFVNTDFALSVLILSMLLSPEINLGGGGNPDSATESERNVVVRIDDLVLALITLTWLVKTAVNKELGIFVRTPLNRPMYVYLLIGLFSTIVGMFMGNVRPMIGILYNVKYFQYFMIYLMAASHIRDMKTWRRYLSLIIFTGVAVSIYAIAQIPSGERVTAPFEGVEGEANTLGGYLVIIISLLLGILTGTRTVSRLAGLLGLLALMLIPFAFTLSRSSWIAMGPALLIVILYSPKRSAVMAGLVAGAVLLAIFLPSTVYERIEYTFSRENELRTDVVTIGGAALDPSTSERIKSWGLTLKQWTQRPVLGWGITGAGFKDAQYFRVLAETGVLGLAAFFWLLASVNRMGLRSLRRISARLHPVYHGIVVGYIAAFWGLLTHAIGANTFIIVRVMEPFWFLTALVMLLPGLLEQEDGKAETAERMQPGAIPQAGEAR